MTGPILAVVKVGGGLSAIPGALERVGAALAAAGRRHRIVVVPGGGPFAEAVRTFEARAPLSPDAAHWMAILGMEQYAYVLAERVPGAALVEEPGAVTSALRGSRVAVLAPYRWMRAADVLPHSWDATSDSVAAFVAGALDARCLLLIKPVSAADPASVVDGCFARVLPAGLRWEVVGLEQVETLGERIDRSSGRSLSGPATPPA